MPYFYVEGLFVTRAGLRRAAKRGRVTADDIEPFGRGFWANSPGEALHLASEALQGGEWTETPRLSQTSEEQRMRRMGQPELPGFENPPRRRRRG